MTLKVLASELLHGPAVPRPLLEDISSSMAAATKAKDMR